MTALLEFCNFSGGYVGVPVVRDFSATVAKGEIVALLGPNGAGKTTSLLSASGLLPVITGDIRISGKSVSKEAPHRIARMGVAHVPDDRSLFFHLTVKQNLLLGARERRPDLDRILELFPALGGLMNRRTELLSGGEQQMLALGRALASNPSLLLVDELSMGLAPTIVEAVLPTLRVVADTGVGILMVEQHVELALEVADRAYILNHGDLVFEGSARDLTSDLDLVEVSYLGQRESVR